MDVKGGVVVWICKKCLFLQYLLYFLEILLKLVVPFKFLVLFCQLGYWGHEVSPVWNNSFINVYTENEPFGLSCHLG